MTAGSDEPRPAPSSDDTAGGPPGMTAAPPAPPAGRPSVTARAMDTAARVSRQMDRTFVGRTWSRLLEVEFVDRSVALAAKAFVSLFPGLILLAAVSPDSVRAEIMDNFSRRFGLSGGAMDTVRQAFASPDVTRAATGILGAVVTFAFMVSFTTALQRTYLRAWRRPTGGGARNKFRGLVWVGGVLAMVFLLGLVRSLIGGPVGSVLSWLFGLVLSTGLWWWTARLMVRSEVRWRALLPTAALTALGSWIYTMAAAVWMPRNLADNFAQFGAFGIALAFVTWFTGVAFVIVVAAVLGPALAEGNGRFGKWLRGPDDSVLVPGARPALPGPSRPMRLSDAFGRGSAGSGVVPAAGEPAADGPSAG